MPDLGQIQEHSEVVGADGRHVGTVDHVDGDRIKLTKSDAIAPGHEGHHHYVDSSLVESVEDGVVRLNVNGADAISHVEEGTS